MDKSRKASKYLRESKETIGKCCSKMIRAQEALDHFFLAMQEKSEKTTEKEEKEIESEIEKMSTSLQALIESINRFEMTWLRNVQPTYRKKKGRQDISNNESGYISVDSSVIPPDNHNASFVFGLENINVTMPVPQQKNDLDRHHSPSKPVIPDFFNLSASSLQSNSLNLNGRLDQEVLEEPPDRDSIV